MTGPATRPAGLRVIIAYKFAKAVFSTGVGALALALLGNGAEAASATLAQQLLDHSTREWALKVATLIVMAGTRRHVLIASVAGFADASVSLLEGIALRSGAWWGPWLVVAATGALLPWELTELLRHPSWVRFIVFVVNSAVVAYLLREARREHVGLQQREAASARALEEAKREMAVAQAMEDAAKAPDVPPPADGKRGPGAS